MPKIKQEDIDAMVDRVIGNLGIQKEEKNDEAKKILERILPKK